MFCTYWNIVSIEDLQGSVTLKCIKHVYTTLYDNANLLTAAVFLLFVL